MKNKFNFCIFEQIDPPSDRPFVLAETFACSEGFRTRVIGRRFETAIEARAYVERANADPA